MAKIAKAADKVGDVVKGTNTVTDTAKAANKVSEGVTTARVTENPACEPGSGACFTEGTQIVVGVIYDEDLCTVEYVTANIESIKVGDYVLAQDVGTGEVSLKEVTDTFIRTSDHLRYLTTVDEEGDIQTIETTDAHPFWVVTDNPDLSRAASEVVIENGTVLYHENLAVTEHGYYVEAKDLKVGDVFIGANGELTTLTDTYREEFPNGITVYNFSVEGNHNYYVIANLKAYQNGASVVLVHNANYNSGIYEFDDLKSPGQKYVGQASEFDDRLSQHMRAGRLDNTENAITTPIPGNKTDREIAEYKRIQELTGGTPARHSDAVSNKRDPIGPKRKHLLDER